MPDCSVQRGQGIAELATLRRRHILIRVVCCDHSKGLLPNREQVDTHGCHDVTCWKGSSDRLLPGSHICKIARPL